MQVTAKPYSIYLYVFWLLLINFFSYQRLELDVVLTQRLVGLQGHEGEHPLSRLVLLQVPDDGLHRMNDVVLLDILGAYVPELLHVSLLGTEAVVGHKLDLLAGRFQGIHGGPGVGNPAHQEPDNAIAVADDQVEGIDELALLLQAELQNVTWWRHGYGRLYVAIYERMTDAGCARTEIQQPTDCLCRHLTFNVNALTLFPRFLGH